MLKIMMRATTLPKNTRRGIWLQCVFDSDDDYDDNDNDEENDHATVMLTTIVDDCRCMTMSNRMTIKNVTEMVRRRWHRDDDGDDDENDDDDITSFQNDSTISLYCPGGDYSMLSCAVNKYAWFWIHNTNIPSVSTHIFLSSHRYSGVNFASSFTQGNLRLACLPACW